MAVTFEKLKAVEIRCLREYLFRIMDEKGHAVCVGYGKNGHGNDRANLKEIARRCNLFGKLISGMESALAEMTKCGASNLEIHNLNSLIKEAKGETNVDPKKK